MASSKQYNEGAVEEEPEKLVVTELKTTYQLPSDQQNPGVIGSVLRAVQGTYQHAKGAIFGKNNDNNTEIINITQSRTNNSEGEVRDISAGKTVQVASDKTKDITNQAMTKTQEYKDSAAAKAKETKDSAVRKAGVYKDCVADKTEQGKKKLGEYKDYAAEKAKQGKDSTVEKIGEYKDYAADKAKQGKDYTAEKAKEGKDVTIDKLGQIKDSVAETAKRAGGFLSDKKEETKHKTLETGENVKEKLGETGDKMREKMEGLKLAVNEMKDDKEGKQNLHKTKDTSLEKGTKGPKGGVTVRVEETKPGYMAYTAIAADQMSGKTYTDVGRLDEDDTAHKFDPSS